LDAGNIEPLRSRLLELLAWLFQQRCSTATIRRLRDLAALSEDAEIDQELGDLLELDDVVELEAQVLALLCEEVVDADDLEAAEALLGDSLAGVQLVDLQAPMRPFARFLSARARAAAEAVPDVERRLRYYRTGLSVGSCIALDALIDELLVEFGEQLWTTAPDREIQDRLIAGALGIVETPPAEDVPVEVAVEIAADWIGYTTMEELRARYEASVPQLADPTTLNLFIQGSFANGAPWALSALLSFLEARIPEGASIAEGLRALPALVKYGVASAQAAYASTLAAEDRDTARKVAEMASRGGIGEGFGVFMGWMSELRIDELRQTLGAGPETDRLARRVARLSTSNLALELVLGRASVVVSVRGLAFGDRTANMAPLRPGDPVLLERERDNPYDANAIQVLLADGRPLGYVARDAARGLAGHLDDDRDSFTASVREIDAAAPLLRLELSAR
jgi:hypothetical protein